ncbi:MAG: Arm DNA-binding domain-containing protein [Pseudomonadota bacterium]
MHFGAPTGSKHWRLRYRFSGKQKNLTREAYPEVSVAMATEQKIAAKALLLQGVDQSDYVQKTHKEAVYKAYLNMRRCPMLFVCLMSDPGKMHACPPLALNAVASLRSVRSPPVEAHERNMALLNGLIVVNLSTFSREKSATRVYTTAVIK